MERWIAVRASAVVSIAGSVIALVCAALMAVGLTVMPPAAAGPFPPAALQVAGVMAALMFAGFGAWGIATGIGIFRRRGWARLSIVIFAAMVIFFGATGLAAMALMPLPENPSVNLRLAGMVRHFIEAFYVALALIGAWWLALFNRAPAKRYFAEAGAATETARPLSISVIGCYLLVGAASTALAAALRVPAVFFGLVATGWAAMALYSAYTAVQVYLGAGLLQLDETSRIWSIVYFLAGAANSALLIVSPHYAAATHDLQARFERMFNREFEAFPAAAGLAVASAAVVAVAIWFLVRRRAAFARGGRA